jgi:hypothetical protein
MKVWSEIQPQGSDFAFEPGERYAVLASVSKNFTLAQIMAKAAAEGFTVTYAWEQGQSSRALYPIDDWLAGLSPDPTDNHRWVWGEGNFDGAAAWTVGVDAPWPLTIYHLQHVFEAVDQPDTATPPTLPTEAECPPAPPGVSPVAAALWTLGGVLVGGIVGIAVGPRLGVLARL